MQLRHPFLVVSLVAFSIFSASAQNEIRGPIHSATIRAPGDNGAIAMKGIVVTVGTNRDAFICYDTDLMRVSMAWTGEFLEFGDTLNKIAWPPPPQVKGTPLFALKAGPGWANDGELSDPRPNGQGPLPKSWAHYEGLFQYGSNVVLKYRVGRTEVLETPSFEDGIFIRTIQFLKSATDQTLVLADGLKPGMSEKPSAGTNALSVSLADEKGFNVSGNGFPKGAEFEVTPAGQLVLRLKKISANKPFQIRFSTNSTTHLPSEIAPADLRKWTKGGPKLWNESVVTQGVRSTNEEPYVVDVITEPTDNPWHVKTFFGGFDFLPDGRAAICTFHGDVFLVSGIDDDLDKLTWTRFATGLFQPLGLKVVGKHIYVLGRDQITRLHDLNRDGEADFYENFNNDTVVTANYHEFCLDLHTDRAGNFYYAKGAPWEPEVTSPHQGCLLKVSKNGKRLEVFATGFRAPNGMTIGPRDQITVGDNQGHWIPSSKLSWVEQGGFYGMTPTAQRELTLHRGGTNFVANPSSAEDRKRISFKGWESSSPQPSGYDEAMIWLPQNIDNSSGGQLWVDSKRFGPLNGTLLFMSYGRCTLFNVMPDRAGGVWQGAMVQLPLKFNSGLMRGRIGPRDGQVYLAGLRGWQTSATRDGGFYRVRHTGAPVRLPNGFRATRDGLEIDFTCALSPESAGDPANYGVSRWNYQWTGAYGSPEFSVTNPNEKKHDVLDVERAELINKGRTVRLKIADMRAADQIKIKFTVDAADGTEVAHEIYGTVRKMDDKAPQHSRR